MNTLINLAVKFSGLGWCWDKLDGYKTYGAAALGIVTGIAGVGAEVAVPLATHNAASLLDVLKHLPADPAWLALIGGFGALGIGHKLEKANDSQPAAAPAQPQA